jgi:hypothetical protein
MNRRAFLKTTATGLGGAFFLAHLPAHLLAATRLLNIPLGFQSWVVKEALANDFSGTLKKMAAEGFPDPLKCVRQKDTRKWALARLRP